MSEYVKRKGVIADLISVEDTYIVVEKSDRRRVRWPRDGKNTRLEFGSLNPKQPNYVPGGKVLGTL